MEKMEGRCIEHEKVHSEKMAERLIKISNTMIFLMPSGIFLGRVKQ